jgi:small-conductance mechanosensitive channel
MPSVAPLVALQTTTPTPGVGVGELVDYWPTVLRGLWFLAGFLATALLGWFVAAPLVTRFIRRRNRNNPTVEEAISRYIRLLAVVVAVFVGAGVAGYGGFVADSAIVIAAATLAVGVAGQTVIGSLVSGVVLVLDPEFNVGNYIEWSDGEGTVRSITLRVTRVHTQDGKLITVPNTVLTGEAITRAFGQGRLRVDERIGLAYEADVDEALEHLRAAAEEIEAIADGPSPNAYVEELGSDSVVVGGYYWIDDPQNRDILAVRSAYVRAAKARLEAAGIDISPTSEHELQGRIAVENVG